MDKHNLIIILDDNITEIDATDISSASILTISGEPSIELVDNYSLDEAVKNLLVKYSIDSLAQLAADIVVINNCAEKNYINYLYSLLSEQSNVCILDWKIIIPMLAHNKGLTLPCSISLNKRSYLVESDRVSLEDSIANNVVSFDELLFLFKPQAAISHEDNTALEALKTENHKLSQKSEELRIQLEDSKSQVIELNEQVSDLKMQYDELQESTITFYESDCNSFKSELAKMIQAPEIIRDFLVYETNDSNSASVYITHRPSGLKYTFSLSRDKSHSEKDFEDFVLSRTAYAINTLMKLQEYLFYPLFPNPNLNVGEIIEFGRSNSIPLQWRIIQKDTNGFLAITVNPVANLPFNKKNGSLFGDHYWQFCSLHKWLNEDFFIGAFNEHEKKVIGETTFNAINVLSTDPTTFSDKVILLNFTEAKEIIESNKALLPDGQWWLRDLRTTAQIRFGLYQGLPDPETHYSTELPIYPVIRIDLGLIK